MSIKDIILAGGSGALQPFSTTYTANGTATWPSGATLTLRGIGGPRSSSTTGYTPSQYPTLNTVLGGKETSSGLIYQLNVTATGFPSSVNTSGTGLSGTYVSLAWPGGFVHASNNPYASTYFDPFTSYAFMINTVTTGGGVTASYLGDFVINAGGLGFVMSDYSPGVQAGVVLANYDVPTNSYTIGTQASLVVNGVTKTFAGQQPDGSNTYTEYPSVSAGATTSGTVTVPAGGSVTVTYYA